MLVLDKKHHLLGGTLLIAGTSIGVGMLALPVVTAAGGFVPSILIYSLAWLFMIGTGLLIVEACLWCPNDSNLITISRHLLGAKGAAGCWVFYLFLFYCLMVAHVAIGGQAIDQLGLGLPNWFSSLLYVVLFAPVVYLGTRAVDRFNVLFISGVVITFLLFIGIAMSHVNLELLGRTEWPLAWAALPIIMTAFGYQNLIPTLMTYMDRDHKAVRKAIIYGTSIPLIIYLIWEFVILGIVPADVLLQASIKGQNAVVPLQDTLHNTTALTYIGQSFAFFAMTTSFIGMAIAFYDFWADGLGWKKRGVKKLALCGLVFGIPLMIVWVNPGIFIGALNLAGTFGISVLLGIYPILYVWSGRYLLGHSKNHQLVKGGKPTLVAMFAFVLLVIFLGYL